MLNFNKVILIGNLTRDPELKKTSRDKRMATFDLAINHKFRNASGREEETVCFVPVVAWDKLAENCAAYLEKGKRAFVEGRLKLNTWEKNSLTHSRLLVQATTVLFLSPPDQNSDSDPIDDEIPTSAKAHQTEPSTP